MFSEIIVYQHSKILGFSALAVSSTICPLRKSSHHVVWKMAVVIGKDYHVDNTFRVEKVLVQVSHIGPFSLTYDISAVGFYFSEGNSSPVCRRHPVRKNIHSVYY
ncbi:hypothetical protein CEXT_157821 [Caerostris extrusa]|uniref:Uncharacterized protein n=1 Tax=Caerostris extrusa TaxID=172846 RepID=A0AAV4XUX1_CAEEX|nr:hypothetical protein CEXT_157821 [Caerostris extrusa]